jgi:hypothetical protein
MTAKMNRLLSKALKVFALIGAVLSALIGAYIIGGRRGGQKPSITLPDDAALQNKASAAKRQKEAELEKASAADLLNGCSDAERARGAIGESQQRFAGRARGRVGDILGRDSP